MSVQFKDDIVITGISGRMPESSNVEEFKENLMKGIDMVTEDDRRWPAGTYDVPGRIGKIKDLESFDASFFGINFTQAHVTDPQLRLLLEVTYEAIVDAGINPTTLRGSRTGVFVGITSSEALEFWTESVDRVNGYGLLGCSRSIFANRISFTFDFHGPSFAMDAACATSLIVFNQAIAAIRAGECDSAIVAGSNLVLQPLYSLHFKKLQLASPDGKCKTFDAAADGMVRAEAVAAIYLQKLTDARRVYATIVHTKTNTDGHKSQGIMFPSGIMQSKLMRQMYDEAEIDPRDVVYVEAHGTGTKAGDVQESSSIDELFCKNRKTPLLVGSVKSNIGHTEAASGLCGLIKVLIAMETGMIPGNLHFNTPNPNIPALTEGRLQVVDKVTPWNGGLVGISSFGFGGTNAHVILRSNPRSKLSPMLNTTEPLPKLLVVSGRTKDAVRVLLDEAKKHRTDEEFISLLHAVHSNDIPGHRIRGYEVLGYDDTRKSVEIKTDDTRRPVWFIFSGMGSQWPGMGCELLGIETFQRSMQRSADALKTHGVDLMSVLLNDPGENIMYSFVSIIAVQIALVDVLTSMGIHPDGMIGHSVGELLCAYCDDETFTLEQTILAAYYRGKAILDSKLESGAMAAIGLSWEETRKICPSDIVPACYNSKNSITISGPDKSVRTFVEELKSKNVFGRIVESSGVAAHSKYIAAIEPTLRALYDKIMPKPQRRSPKWISTSVPEAAWDSPLARFNSTDYHVNNMMCPVLFYDAIMHIPDNAITIEIAPHGLLQAILCRSLPPTVTNISLQKWNYSNNLTFLLSNIGKLYTAGAQPDVSKLYPPLNFPVGRGTPMIGHLVKWDHSLKWDVPKYDQKSGQRMSNECLQVDLSKKMYSYLAEHKIDGQIVLPHTGYLIFVWKIFAQMQNTHFERLPVIFEEVRFQRAIFMSKDQPTKLSISILKETGKFEVCEADALVVSGNIRTFAPIEDESVPCVDELCVDDENFTLTSKEIYKELRIRGHEYGGIFQSIKSCDERAIIGELCWYNEWIPYVNSMIQFSMLCNSRKLLYESYIPYLAINPLQHKRMLEQLRKDEGLPVHHYKNINVIKSGGTEIKGLEFSSASRCQQSQNPKYEQYTFMPYEHELSPHEDPLRRKLNAFTVLLQIMIENVMTYNIKIVEVADERAEEFLLAPLVLDILRGEPLITIDIQVAVSSDNHAASLSQMNVDIVIRDAKNAPPAENVQLVVAANVLSNRSHNILNNLTAALNPNGFILLEETSEQLELQDALSNTNVVLVANYIDPSGKNYILLKKQEKKREPIIIEITQKHLSWLETLKAALEKTNKDQDVLLVSQGEEISGVAGLATCIWREILNVKTRFVYDQSKYSPKFDISADFYKKQLDKGLVSNVYKNGKWGSYRHLRLDESNMTTVEHAYVDSLVKDDLSSLRWVESPLNYYKPDESPNSTSVLCNVYYAVINWKDVKLASGKLDVPSKGMTVENCIFGLEFSGKNTSDGKVMGMVQAGGLATTVIADSDFLWKVPDKWTLEEAATIPIAYAFSYYALFVRGQLKAGETILILNGTDDVSQASITLALHAGCTIFTTVDTPAKRRYITKTFPQLTDEFIGNSRDTSFEELILTKTRNRGVDVVLNSVANMKLQAGIRCLAKHGRFLNFTNDNCTETFLGNMTFHNIMLSTLFKNDAEKRKVAKLVEEGIDNNVIRPLPRIVFPKNKLEEGFRYAAIHNRTEKVLLEVQREECTLQLTTAVRRTYMNPKKSYVLIGGLGGFGLELANWLILRGAKYIVFISRSGIRTGYQAWFVRRWRENGIKVVVSTEDVTTLSGATRMIEESDRLAPIGGIFNLAAVLRDGIIQNLKEADFNAAMSPKIDITRNLDMISAHYYSQLDYFIVFSSMSAGRGNAGQCNYGLASSAMERLIEKRYASGKPCCVIQWSAIADTGLYAELIGDGVVAGIEPQRLSSALETWNTFLQLSSYPVLSTMIIPEKHKFENNRKVGLVENVIGILGIKDVSLVDPNDSLNVLGMDSLMDIEVQRALEMNHNIVLSPQEIRGLTISKLHELASQQSS